MLGNYLFVCFVVLLFGLVSLSFVSKDDKLAKIGNYSFLAVSGNSMHPAIKNGDFIVINRKSKETYQVGDIISFIANDGETIITHSIIEVKEFEGEYRYFTKGINNNYQDNDYIVSKQIIGIYEDFRIPLIGYIIGFLNTKIGYILFVVLPLGLILAIVIYELIKEVLKERGET